MYVKVINRKYRQNNDEQGSILRIVIIVVLILMLGTPMMFNLPCEHLLAQTTIAEVKAFYAAEIGVAYALRRLKIPDNWLVGLKGKQYLTQEGVDGYSVSFDYDDPANKKGTIVSTGTYKGEKKQIVVSVRHKLDSPFKYTVCGCNSVFIVGNTGTDSYDSSKGAYGYSNFDLNGNIASNGDLSLGQGIIHGKVIARGDLDGPNDCTISGDAIIGGNDIDWKGKTNGLKLTNYSPAPAPCDCLIDITTPINSAATNNNNSKIPHGLTGTELVVDSNDNITLNNGTYYFTRLEIRDNGKIHIGTLPVDIYLTGDGPFEIGGSGIVNPSERASYLSIISDSNVDLNLSAKGSFAGKIYAPNSDVELTNYGDIFGSIVARNLRIVITGNLHYDKHLVKYPGSLKGDVIVELDPWTVY